MATTHEPKLDGQHPADTGAGSATASEATSLLDGHRTRRSLFVAALGAAGAFVAQAVGRPMPVRAADVVLGGTNNTTATTTIRNNAASSSAVAIVGRTTYTGLAQQSRGVVGLSAGENGVGVSGSAAVGTAAQGVLGVAAQGTGVRAAGGQTGVLGTGTNYGAYGKSTSNYGVFGDGGYAGVFGTGPYGTYGSGTSAGAIGTSGAGYGLYGLGAIGVVGIGDGNGYGAWGYNADSGGYGVVGQGGYRGVYGSGGNAGVYGTSGYVGVWGNASATTGVNYGVYAATASTTDGYAGVFSGKVQVSGFLSKLGGGFKVDHPLAPADKYLVHSFVEAPEMLNIYSGTVTLDKAGKAKVALPSYFEAANRDFRYQLTAVGSAMPDLHVAAGVKGNTFSIAGGAASRQVSWQVTAARNDAWAVANPMEVEPKKAATEQGKFLTPKLFGKTDKDSVVPAPEVIADRAVAERKVKTMKGKPAVNAPHID
jgi:hypothetical protein